MKLHLLMTGDMNLTKPKTCEIIADFGILDVVFTNEDDGIEEVKRGLHCIVEDTKDNIIKWLLPYDEVVVGNGSPMTESFQIMHIKDNL